MKKDENMLVEQLAVYIVAVVAATVIFVVVVTRHVNVNLALLVQAIPAILAAVAAIQRSMAGTSSQKDVAAKIIDLADRTRANSAAAMPPTDPSAPAEKQS
jgi:hypothetical protein